MRFVAKVGSAPIAWPLLSIFVGRIFEALSASLETLKEMKVNYEIVFMDASDETLIRRYKESRRSHPLAPSGRITTGLRKERQILDSVRHKADYIIDTTDKENRILKGILRKRFTQVKINTACP